jgi:hypothetical protein
MTMVGDTTASARRQQLDVFRRVGGPRRLLMALQMRDEVRAVTEAGIRHRHPEWSDEQLHAALVELLTGVEPARPRLARLR